MCFVAGDVRSESAKRVAAAVGEGSMAVMLVHRYLGGSLRGRGLNGRHMNSEECVRDELRTLFLFEHLSDEQLDILCEAGHIETFRAGPLVIEGEPATCFYVLIDGELVMSKRSGGVDIQTNRTSQRGVYFGAWSAYIPGEEQALPGLGSADQAVAVLRAATPTTFAEFMRTAVPDGGAPAGGAPGRRAPAEPDHRAAREAAGPGHHHRRAHPSAQQPGRRHRARRRRSARDASARCGTSSPWWPTAKFTPEALRVLVSIQDEVAEQVAKNQGRRAVRAGGLRPRGRRSATGWKTTTSSAPGTTPPRSSRPAWTPTGWSGFSRSVDEVDATASLQGAIGWLKYTIDNELRMNEIAEASKRISALLAGAKQYSQMDRGPYGSADVHELLRSTIMMFGDKIGRPGKGRPVSIVKDLDKTLPELQCYPGDLNQVWTNIIDNAIQAMDGHGHADASAPRGRTSEMIRVEICDDGPGIPEDVIERIFTPFFTTKPFGEGTGLGLDLAWRIVGGEARRQHLGAEQAR